MEVISCRKVPCISVTKRVGGTKASPPKHWKKYLLIKSIIELRKQSDGYTRESQGELEASPFSGH